MSYETMLVLRNMECEKNRATRMQVREKAKRLESAYTNAGLVSVVSMLAGGVLYKSGVEIVGTIFMVIGAFYVNSMMKKCDQWHDYCHAHHV